MSRDGTSNDNGGVAVASGSGVLSSNSAVGGSGVGMVMVAASSEGDVVRLDSSFIVSFSGTSR
jgi:hypothetical protein